jgi:hypothetical protein
MAPRPRTLHHAEDIGSALKGGVNVCQRQLVNEVLGFLVTEFVPNFRREDATPIQRGSNASLLGRVQAIKLIRHALISIPKHKSINGCPKKEVGVQKMQVKRSFSFVAPRCPKSWHFSGLGDVRLESAWAKADIDQVAVTNRAL